MVRYTASVISLWFLMVVAYNGNVFLPDFQKPEVAVELHSAPGIVKETSAPLVSLSIADTH